MEVLCFFLGEHSVKVGVQDCSGFTGQESRGGLYTPVYFVGRGFTPAVYCNDIYKLFYSPLFDGL